MDINARELAGMMREIQRRQGEYSAHDVIAARDRLVAKWRAMHPESAAEPASSRHHTLEQIQNGVPDNVESPEIWFNDVYQVTVRRWSKDPVFGTGGGMIQIGINSHDGTARHDWRDFQGIKNQMAGPECEGFELYPAESRLLDPSNYYSLWCFPGLKRIKVGKSERVVRDADVALAPQRGFARSSE